MSMPLPPVPQTERRAPPLPPDEMARLLASRRKEDQFDLFANDPDAEIRKLGRLALRRSPADVDDAFALGDLCAQRVLVDDQLRVFYVGKTLTAYRRAMTRADNDVDRNLAEMAIVRFVMWVAEVALYLPTPRNVAVALWAAAEMEPQQQPEMLQDAIAALIRQYPVNDASAFTPAVSPQPAVSDDTTRADEDVLALMDTQDEVDVSEVFSDVHEPQDVEQASPDSPVADQPGRHEGAISAMDMPPRVSLSRPSQTTEDEFWPGDRIEDRYEVAQVLRGGMGVVYLCYDHEQREPVAIKSFQARFFDNERVVARFTQEALTWIRLEKHRHIVQARVVHTVRDRPHIFLEHISGPEGLGPDLRAWIDHNRLTLDLAVRFGLHIALGMQHAVRQVPGLVHRDLKPANILVTHDEVAKVTDFGLVHSVVSAGEVPLHEDDGDIMRLTRVGSVVGTAPYMSPEQCRAEEVDQRADIYAFGCILYEMLTGRPVFQARKFFDWLTAHLNETPQIPSDVSGELPADLRTLLLACLEKSPTDRPSDWGEVADGLATVYEDITGEQAVMAISGPQLEAHELMDKGYSLTELGRAEEALEAYDRALELQPDYAWAWARKGRTLRLLERYDEALACFEQAITLSPSYGWAWNGKGIVLERQGRIEEALEAYRQAAMLKPGDVWPWYNQADILQSMGRFEEALPLLDRALNADPMHAHSWAKRGQNSR